MILMAKIKSWLSNIRYDKMMQLFKIVFYLDVVVCTYNPRTREVEAEGSWIWVQPVLHISVCKGKHIYQNSNNETGHSALVPL
jgi:hypothetical protein